MITKILKELNSQFPEGTSERKTIDSFLRWHRVSIIDSLRKHHKVDVLPFLKPYFKGTQEINLNNYFVKRLKYIPSENMLIITYGSGKVWTYLNITLSEWIEILFAQRYRTLSRNLVNILKYKAKVGYKMK